MEKNYRILLIDDEPDFLFMTGRSLENSGFDIQTAHDGREGLNLIRGNPPDLVLLDLNMPEPDGHQVCEMIKSDNTLQNIPVIILTASDDLSDKLRRLEGGADDYITKYTDQRELEARIRAVIRRNQKNLDSNPLTRLPGNNTIQEQIMQHIAESRQFAVAYTDLDNFKAYNDKYGFQRGDDLILFTAGVLKNAVRDSGSQAGFVGHIGGDDFVIISETDHMRAICRMVTGNLDAGIPGFYDEKDREAGFIATKDRQGIMRRFPLVSISIAVTSNQNRQFENIGEIIRTVTELKKLAKQKKGSCVVYDKRNE
jgi:diguanylate cyclase (GGDEF)-like protein